MDVNVYRYERELNHTKSQYILSSMQGLLLQLMFLSSYSPSIYLLSRPVNLPSPHIRLIQSMLILSLIHAFPPFSLQAYI